MSTVAQDLIPQPEDRTSIRRFALWFGVLGGIISWAAHLGISWALVPYSCNQDDVFWLHANTVVFAVITLIAFLTALVTYRRVRKQDRTRKPVETDRFMSILGMLTSGLFLLLIIVEGSSVFVLQPCGIAS